MRGPDPEEPHPDDGPSVLDRNVRAIARWEQAALHDRSRAERYADRITRAAAQGWVILLHVTWFGAWILINTGIVPTVAPFDPFPFPLLTLAVSLEAIFLTLFVLASQNQLSQQADKRAHLDLQIDLLAEQEMTIVLRLLEDVARKLEVNTAATSGRMRELLKTTDIHRLADRLDEINRQSTVPTDRSAERDGRG
jgi:uncharacterized membrane protein